MTGKDLMEHYNLGDRIIMLNELQKALGQAKTDKAIRINKIPNEILNTIQYNTSTILLLVLLLFQYIYTG